MEQSVGDPDKTFITVPNIPFFTGMAKIRDNQKFSKGLKAAAILKTGLGTPFINVSFSGLLWGYNDELPCFTKSRPNECGAGDDDFFKDDDESCNIQTLLAK